MPLHDEWNYVPADSSTPIPSLRSETIARIAGRRAAASELSADAFLNPAVDHLHDGLQISGMPQACERIERAIRDGEQILIYGDYDVDGVTSIVLLTRVIRLSGGKVDHVVPLRLIDGYGLKLHVLERVLAEENVKLVITVDCGITSIEPVARTLERGIDVIVTDHHLPPEFLPEALAVLNPKKAGCDYPFKELAGVGVAFKLATALLQRGGKKVRTESLLKIAALGTIADVAPLIGENRTIARLGLDGLGDPRNVGLRVLVRELGLLGRRVTARDVGFKIGPRINAAGRLASADTAIRLFSVEREDEALPLVTQLDELNTERQGIERLIIGEAESVIAAAGAIPRLIIVAGEGWHRGVLGLCAGRLAQRFHRPTLVMSLSDEECVGSGRSIPTINLHALLSSCGELFSHFGGHEFACGFSFYRQRLDDIRGRLSRSSEALSDECYRRSLGVETELRFTELTTEFRDELELLEPFGAGNRVPAFLTTNVKVGEVREFSSGCNSVMLQDDGIWHSAVLWPSCSPVRDLFQLGARLDVAYSVDADRYGRNGMRLEIIDAAKPGESPLRNETAAALVSSRS